MDEKDSRDARRVPSPLVSIPSAPPRPIRCLPSLRRQRRPIFARVRRRRVRIGQNLISIRSSGSSPPGSIITTATFLPLTTRRRIFVACAVGKLHRKRTFQLARLTPRNHYCRRDSVYSFVFTDVFLASIQNSKNGLHFK